RVSAIDGISGRFGDARLHAVFDLEADAGRLAVGIRDRDVGQMDRGRLRKDAGLLRCSLPGAAADQVEPLHDGAGIFRDHLQDLTGLALVLAREDDDFIALLDLGSHYSTSGASEIIFMWFFERSSRGTGPKIRVPIGSAWLLISTAALRSKRMIVPSAR